MLAQTPPPERSLDGAPRKLQLTKKERESDSWVIEENGSRCKLLFDKAGAVMKKKKIISTD